ncbi:predicted protein [Scheffersomyces stipitis CBS 6054]|uniref:BZIP domain-containing protein n=1 Tax=Scheffersomyces stipitis (strain ATCC 58785 / CBS 6054 / NBRC 10063 / NRRL Y-11545) TaxID=322104 RepID=A3LYL5_PICST|nr:predicted protein [Scheffersomyces stipitis CBS 6054]ABN68191.2 predicted protein [Scheffersomyces stipitis CBS 6054]
MNYISSNDVLYENPLAANLDPSTTGGDRVDADTADFLNELRHPSSQDLAEVPAPLQHATASSTSSSTNSVGMQIDSLGIDPVQQNSVSQSQNQNQIQSHRNGNHGSLTFSKPFSADDLATLANVHQMNNNTNNNNTNSNLNSNNNNSNNATSSLFAFHNPFDFKSYPITNPPIFDSTLLLPLYSNDGVPRRRRISISNGQIGQIVNHEALFEDDSGFDTDLGVTGFGNSQGHSQISSPPQAQLSSMNSNTSIAAIADQQQQQPQQVFPGNFNSQAVPPQYQPQITFAPASTSISVSPNPQTPVASPQKSLSKSHSRKNSTAVPELTGVAGVPPPNHQLIYNNEVIYNPNNGPIPGTAAWKKERLLERNRIAASKCRERKKQAQLELQGNISKMKSQYKRDQEKIKKLNKLVEFYNKTIVKHLNDGNQELSVLRKFINKDIDEIDIKDIS